MHEGGLILYKNSVIFRFIIKNMIFTHPITKVFSYTQF